MRELNQRRDGRRTFLCSEFALIVLILCGLLFNPYRFAVSDHTYKIPLLIAAFDDTLYARDITIPCSGV